MRNLIQRLFRPKCSHSYTEVSANETGRLCFSFNCARPEIEVTSVCNDCGETKVDKFMSGMPGAAVPLTPEVASIVLHDEFGVQ